MSDTQHETDLEARLRRSFRSEDLPVAPGRLVEAQEHVTDAPVARRSGERAGRGRRTTFGLLGVAAVLLVGGGLALSAGGRVAPPEATPFPIGTRITYQVAWTDAVPASADTLTAEVAAIRRRIDATGAVGVTVASVAADTITVTFPVGFDADPVRALIGRTGRVAFVPLGDTQANDGDVVDPASFPPLFGSEGLADARVGVDQQGRRILDLTLAPAAARLFGDYTASHVGSTVAITLDDRVISAPRIMSAIPDGDVQISQDGTIGGWDAAEAAQLVAILRSPLPAPLVEISVEPSPVTPSGSPVASVVAVDASPAPSPASPFPWTSGLAFEIPVSIPIDMICEAVAYRSFTLHIDPSVPDPVSAIADTGAPLGVIWSGHDHGLVGPPATIVDAAGGVIARDGTAVQIPRTGKPMLADRVVCTVANAVAVSGPPKP